MENDCDRNQLHFCRLVCAVSPTQILYVLRYTDLCFDLGIQLEEAIQLLQVYNYFKRFEQKIHYLIVIIEQTDYSHGNNAAMYCGPDRLERLNHTTDTECTDILRAQQALTGRVGDLPT